VKRSGAKTTGFLQKFNSHFVKIRIKYLFYKHALLNIILRVSYVLTNIQMKDDKKLAALRDFILSAEKSIQAAKKMLAGMEGGKESKKEVDYSEDIKSLSSYESENDKIIEGVFTGESMFGADGNLYPVPQNYASKSLLVQGSKLKAVIHEDGKITYKIIEEIPYETSIGIVTKNGEKFQILANGKTYNTLMASVTYLKLEVGESVSIRVPKGKDATFAALEAKIPKI